MLFLVVLFCTFPAFAGEAGKLECTLKNTEFCGRWQDDEGKDVLITGDKIVDEFYDSTDTCKVMKEARLEDGRPLSLIICGLPPTSTTPDRSPYLLVMLPQDEIDKRIDAHLVHMLTLYPPDPENPCFSDDVVKRKSCDLPAFYERHKGRGYFVFGR